MGILNYLFGLIAGGVTKREYGKNEWSPPPPTDNKEPDTKDKKDVPRN